MRSTMSGVAHLTSSSSRASSAIHLHVADSFDHRASSGLRYIVNPPGSTVRIHQHLDIGQGEVNWDELFDTLGRLRFDGTMTACVFAWEDRARESSVFMRREMAKRTASW